MVSIQSIREDTEQRAKDICDRKGNAFESLTETTAVPPYIVRHERVMRMGYGDVDVVKLLRAAGIIVSTARGLRTALLITDNAGLHFPCTNWQIVQVIRSNPGCLSEAVTLR